MVAAYTQGEPVTLSVPVKDSAGGDIAPSAASWSLFDQTGTVVTQGTIADPNPVSKVVEVVIAGEHNQSTDPRAARELVVTFTVAGGVVEQRVIYLINASSVLALMENSFLTYPEALLIRQSFGGLFEGWDASDRLAQCSALSHAYQNLGQLAYKVGWGNASDLAGYSEGDDRYTSKIIPSITSFTSEQFLALPPKFQTALKRAQLVEADMLLGGDVLGKRRRDGVLSETIGESSMMFNSRPYLELPVSRAAYRELNGYIYRSIGIARTV